MNKIIISKKQKNGKIILTKRQPIKIPRNIRKGRVA